MLSGPENTAEAKPVNFVRVGDAVFHRWSCQGPLQQLYCMIVHSCTAEDGESTVYDVIDQHGFELSAVDVLLQVFDGRAHFG